MQRTKELQSESPCMHKAHESLPSVCFLAPAHPTHIDLHDLANSMQHYTILLLISERLCSNFVV